MCKVCKVFMECNNYVLPTVLLPDRLEVPRLGTLVRARVSNANHAPLVMRNFKLSFRDETPVTYGFGHCANLDNRFFPRKLRTF